jgi:L-histidine Nalpha-methyltransferase
MDLRLRSETPQRVTIPGADLVLDLAVGEEIRVEISTKFRISKIAAELEQAGFAVTRVWTDAPADFALTLATKPH